MHEYEKLSPSDYNAIDKVASAGYIFPSEALDSYIHHHDSKSTNHVVAGVVYNNMIRNEDYMIDDKVIIIMMIRKLVGRIYNSGILFATDSATHLAVSYFLEKQGRTGVENG